MPRNTRAQKRKTALSVEEKVEKVEMKEDGKEKDIPLLEIDEGLNNSKEKNTEGKIEGEMKGKESVEEGSDDKGSSAEEVEGGKVLQNVEEQKKGEENNEKEKESEINNGETKNKDCIDAQKNEQVGESESNLSEEMQSDNTKTADKMEVGLQCSDARGVNINKCALIVQGFSEGSSLQDFRLFANNLCGMDLDMTRRKTSTFQVRIDLPDEETRTRALEALNNTSYKDAVLRTHVVNSESDKQPRMTEAEIILKHNPLHDKPYDEQLKIKSQKVNEAFQKMSLLIKRKYPSLSNWIRTQNENFDDLPCKLEPIVASPVVEECRRRVNAGVALDPQTDKWVVGLSKKQFSCGVYKQLCPLDGLKDIPQVSKDAAKLFETCLNEALETEDEDAPPAVFCESVCINALDDGRVALVAKCYATDDEKALDTVKEKIICFFENGEGKDSVVKSLFFNGLFRETRTPFTFSVGEKHVYETVNGVTFRLAPVMCFPFHRKTLEKLLDTVLDLAPKGKDVALVGFGCRSHWIGYSLSKAFGEVHIMGVENTEDARFDAEANHITNCHFHPSDFSEQVKIVVENIQKKNIVVLIYHPYEDSKKNLILSIRPLSKVKTVICVVSAPYVGFKCFYQSCLKPLSGSPLVPIKAVPVDLFPYTDRCRVVILMERMEMQQLNLSNNPVTNTNLHEIALANMKAWNETVTIKKPQDKPKKVERMNPQDKAVSNTNPHNKEVTNINPQHNAVIYTNIHNKALPERVGNWVQNRNSFSQEQGVQNSRFGTGSVGNWKDPSSFEQQDSSPIFSNVFFGEPLIRQIAERLKAGVLGQPDRLTFAKEALRKFDAEVARQQQLLGLSNVNMNTPNANLPGCGLKPLPSLMMQTVRMPTPPSLVNERIPPRSRLDSNIPVQFANDARSNVLTERSFEVRADRVTTRQTNDGFMEPWKKRAKVDGGRLRESCDSDASGVGRSNRTTTPDVPFVANQSAEYQRKFEMLRSAGLSEKEIRFILHRSSMEVVASGERERRNFQDDRAGCSSRQIGEGLNPSRDQGTRFQQLGNQGELRHHSIDERFTELQFENQLRRDSDFDRVRESEANRAGNAEFDGIRRADLHQRLPNVFRVNRDLPGSFRHFEGDRANRHFDTIRGERNLDGDLDDILDDRDIDVILGDLDVILKDKDVERERDVRTSRGVRDGRDLRRDFERDPDRTGGSNIIDWSRV